MVSILDDALDSRFTSYPDQPEADLDSADRFIIYDNSTGEIKRLDVSSLAGFFGSNISEADILAALSAPDGVATLGTDGKVPSTQLPSYVDDVLEYADSASFPATGESGKIYVAQDTNLTYRWTGSVYVEISQSLALGETSSTAYRGDRGKTAYDHSQVTTGNPHSVTASDVGLGNVDNTSDANKPVSTAQQTALDGKASISSATGSLTVGSITVGPTPGASPIYTYVARKIADVVYLEFVIYFGDSGTSVAENDRFSFTGLPWAPTGGNIESNGQGWQYASFGGGNNGFWNVGATNGGYLYFYCTHVSGALDYSRTIRGSVTYRTSD